MALPAVIAAGAAGATLIGSSLFNQREADKNRRFQERMSSTQYQRGVTDMRKAGLNPLLMSGGQPAAQPQGDSATAGQADQSSIQALLADLQSRQTTADVRLKGSQTELTQAEADVARAEAQRIKADTGLIGQRHKTEVHVTEKTRSEIQKVLADTGLSYAQRDHVEQQAEVAYQQAMYTVQQRHTSKAQEYLSKEQKNLVHQQVLSEAMKILRDEGVFTLISESKVLQLLRALTGDAGMGVILRPR
jgi:hypothetical protein